MFSKFSIDRICFSIDRKCDLNFVLNLTYSIAVGSIESYFQSIKSIFRSIENRIESFLKPLFLTCSNTISKLSNAFLSLFDRSKIPSKIFCHFRPNFFKGFCHLRPVRHLYPSFFIYFHVFMHFRENVEPMKIWDFC